MNAIIVTGGKQYKVAEGDVVYIEKLNQEAGDTVKFDQVLAILDGDKATFGTPVVEGASVEANDRQERQGQEDPHLQVQRQEGLPQASGPSSALHQGRDRQDLRLSHDHCHIPYGGRAGSPALTPVATAATPRRARTSSAPPSPAPSVWWSATRQRRAGPGRLRKGSGSRTRPSPCVCPEGCPPRAESTCQSLLTGLMVYLHRAPRRVSRQHRSSGG